MSPASASAQKPTAILIAEDNKYDQLILREVFNELALNVQLFFVTDGVELLDYLHRRNAYASPGQPRAPMSS